MRNIIILILILTGLSVPLMLLDYNHFPYSDGAEHGAAVRELAANLLNPADPLLAGVPGHSPRFVPSIAVMALTMRLLGLDVLTTLKLFLIIGLLLFLASAALFSRAYCNGGAEVIWALLSLLFLWGLGWMGSNAYMFSALLYTAYFPSVVSFSLSLLGLAAQLAFLRGRKTGFLAATLVIGALAFVNHPLTGVFFFTCSGLLFLEKGLSLKQAGTYCLLSVCCALVLSALWPYYSLLPNLLKVLGGGMAVNTDYQTTHHYLYSRLLLRCGPALAGIPCLAFVLPTGRHLMLKRGFLLFALVYGLGYLFTINLAERFIFYIVFTLQMACAPVLAAYPPGSPAAASCTKKNRARQVLIPLLALGMAVQMVSVFNNFISPAFVSQTGSLLPRYVNPNALQMELRNYCGRGDVVLSDIYSSWSIPVYTGAKIIALFHSSPHVDDNRERVKDIETFYSRETTNETRLEIIERYGVTHILLNVVTAGRDIKPLIKEMGFPVLLENDAVCIFSVPRTTLPLKPS